MSGFIATGILFAVGLSIGPPVSSIDPPAPSIPPSGILGQESRSQDARTQEGSLARALALFAGADSNHDGKLTAEEARSLPVSAEAFGAEDADRDGFWSREEFLLFYRHQLVASRQPVGADLDAEITRIQALKRVDSVDPARKPKCETSSRTADPSSLNQRFETILADVEAKCAAHRADRDDFRRLRNVVVLNGRAAARGSASAASDTQSAMLEAIDRIEKHSVQGQYTRDEFETLRRASFAENVSKPSAPPNVASPNAVPRDAASRDAPPRDAPPREPADAPDVAKSAAKSTAAPTRPAPSAPPSSSPAPAAIGPVPSPAGPAAGRQRPPPAPPPKPAPHPAPTRPSSDPSDRSKP